MTNDEFWTLPGPHRFVEGIASCAAGGKCMIVGIPETLLSSVLVELRRVIRSQDCRADTVDTNLPPLDAISGHLQGQHLPESLETVVAACGNAPRVFLAATTSWQESEAWRGLIAEFQHRISHLAQRQRPTIVLLTSDLKRPCADDVALVCRSWIGAWSEADALVLAQITLRSAPKDQLLRDIIVHTVARLALWDVELFELLGSLPPEAILKPHSELQRLAARRRWNGNTPADVNQGTAGYVGERLYCHSALLALSDAESRDHGMPDGEFFRRCWQAQAAVLLPWIEEMRLELLQDAERYLPGLVGKPSEIREIGSIWFDLVRTNAPVRLKKRAALLRDARNDIAHLNLLSPGRIRSLGTEFTPSN